MAHTENHGGGTKEVIKITIYLTILTIVELALGFMMMKMVDGSQAKFITKLTIVFLMLVKAYFIVGYFMHLKHEIRNMIMTIVVPLCLFIWFIGAFLYEGNSFKNLRNRYDPHFKEQSTIKVEKKEHGEAGKHEEKAEEPKAEESK